MLLIGDILKLFILENRNTIDLTLLYSFFLHITKQIYLVYVSGDSNILWLCATNFASSTFYLGIL